MRSARSAEDRSVSGMSGCNSFARRRYERFTSAADAVLEEKGVTVVPDILTNAGGVVVSYFEWLQNLQAEKWDEDEINRKLEHIMVRSFHDVWNMAEKAETSLRMGAYMLALDRLVTASKLRGITF